jgi:hypothetical protein
VERAKRLRELDLEDQERKLEEAADKSRQARDEETRKQIEALQERERKREEDYQRQQAALQQALQDQLALRVKALEKEEADREQSYSDERDAQRVALADELQAQIDNLSAGSETWAQFVEWLQGKGASGMFGAGMPDPVAAMKEAGGAQGSSFADAFIEELKRAWWAYLGLQEAITGKSPLIEWGRAQKFFSKTTVPASTTATPGTATSTMAGGRGGTATSAGTTIVINNPTFLGTSQREVFRSLGAKTSVEQKRNIAMSRM